MAKTLFLIVMAVFLIGSFWWAGWVWVSLGDAEMSVDGNIALVLGVVGSIVIGVVLMVLLFQSGRRGYDVNLEYENLEYDPSGERKR